MGFGKEASQREERGEDVRWYEVRAEGSTLPPSVRSCRRWMRRRCQTRGSGFGGSRGGLEKAEAKGLMCCLAEVTAPGGPPAACLPDEFHLQQGSAG